MEKRKSRKGRVMSVGREPFIRCERHICEYTYAAQWQWWPATVKIRFDRVRRQVGIE